MTLKDWWKSKPYWLRGGIIGLAFTFILNIIYIVTLGFNKILFDFPFGISYGYITKILDVFHINYFATWFIILCTFIFWFIFSSIIAIIIKTMNKFIDIKFPKLLSKNRLSLDLGIIFFFLSLLIIGTVTYEEYISCAPDWESMCGFGTAMFNLPMILVLGDIIGNNIPPSSFSVFLLVLSSSIFWFFLGAAIGWIIIKIKSK